MKGFFPPGAHSWRILATLMVLFVLLLYWRYDKTAAMAYIFMFSVIYILALAAMCYHRSTDNVASRTLDQRLLFGFGDATVRVVWERKPSEYVFDLYKYNEDERRGSISTELLALAARTTPGTSRELQNLAEHAVEEATKDWTWLYTFKVTVISFKPPQRDRSSSEDLIIG